VTPDITWSEQFARVRESAAVLGVDEGQMWGVILWVIGGPTVPHIIKEARSVNA
jgi:hypothetical protein